MPIPPGVVAFFQLRKTVHRWETEGLPIERGGSGESALEPAAEALAGERRTQYYKK
jgi:hypothetical protein